MPLFTVDPDLCNMDGLCAAECPAGCIEFSEKSLPFPHEKKQAYCLHCGHCVAVCPTDAIRLKRFPQQAVRKERSLNVSFEQVGQFLKGRRSVRSFKEEPLEPNDIAKLVSITEYAPSGHNARLTKWAVATSREKVTEVAESVINWMRTEVDKDSPLAAKLYLSGIVRAWDSGLDLICRNAPALAVAYGPTVGITPREDAIIATTYLELAATGAGLGACWCGYLVAAAAYHRGTCGVLGVPENATVYGALMLGRPVRRHRSIPPRPEPDIQWLY